MCTAVQHKEFTGTRAAIVQKHSQSLGSLGGAHAWGQGRWKYSSPLRARSGSAGREVGAGRNRTQFIPGGCLGGGCTAGQRWLDRTSSAEAPVQSSGHVTEEHKRLFWGHLSQMDTGSFLSPQDAPAPAAMAVTSAGFSCAHSATGFEISKWTFNQLISGKCDRLR